MDMDSKSPSSRSNRTKLVCRYIPDQFLDKNIAEEYFGQFGPCQVRLIIKRKSCIVEYDDAEDAENAMEGAGEYLGVKFKVNWYNSPLKRKMVKKPTDLTWSPTSEIEEELRAMAETGMEYKNLHTLRSNEKQLKRRTKKVLAKSWTSEAVSKIKSATKLHKWTSDQVDLFKVLQQPALGVEEKYRVLEARDKLIRLCTKKEIDMRSTCTVGTCPDMCSEKERLMREVQHQVSAYEQDPYGKLDPTLCIKQYSRSSADQEMPLPHELRPVSVLQLTMGYLMHCIMNLCDTPDVNLGEWYHFLWDRTRGIRKDITQQELCSQGSVELIEQCARFHIHCSARLVAEDPSVFDQKINSENLTKCLQTLKYMYHDLNLKGESCPNEAEFRAYIILLNLNDGNFMWEVQQLKPEIQKSPEVNFALKIHSAIDKNNYVKFFKLVNSTEYLYACILLRYFVQVRTKALSTIVKCYSSRIPYTHFSLFELKHLLAFEDSESAIDFISSYGLYLNEVETHVVLDRKAFMLPEIPYALDRAIDTVESKRRYTVGKVVCGGPLPLPLFRSHVPVNSFDQNGFFIMDNTFKELIKYDTNQIMDEPDSKVTSHQEISSTTAFQKPPIIEKPVVLEPTPSIWLNKPDPSTTNATSFFEKAKSIPIFGEPQQPLPLFDNQKLKEPLLALPELQKAGPSTSTSFFVGYPHAQPGGNQVKSIFGNPQPFEQKQIFTHQEPQISTLQEPKLFTPISSLTTKLDLKIPSFDFNNSIQSNFDPQKMSFDWEESPAPSESSSPTADEQSSDKFDYSSRHDEAESLAKLKEKELEEERERKIEESNRRKLEEIKRIKFEEEQEFKKQRLLEIEKKKRQEQERLKREKLRKIEEAKKREKIRLENLEIKQSVEQLMEDLLLRVEEKAKEERLKEISNKNVRHKMKLFVQKWHKKCKVKRKIKECLNFYPIGLPYRAVPEMAKELLINSQSCTLSDIKRYKSGKSTVLNLPSEPKFEKINVARFYKILVNSYSKLYQRFQKELFWKITVSLPTLKEFKGGLRFIEEFLTNIFQWKNVSGRTNIIGQYVAENRLSYCIERKQGISMIENSTSGLLFIAENSNETFLKRITESLKCFPKYVSIPVSILFINSNPEDLSTESLQQFLKNNIHVSQYNIAKTKIDYLEMFSKIEESLDFLAESLTKPPPLELNFLGLIFHDILVQRFWKKIAAYTEWNSKYEMCLRSPKIVVSLYNEAVDKLKDVLLDESCLKYSDFPNEFEKLLMEQIPDVMPCNFKYFPSFWKTEAYRNLLLKKINSIKLPQFERKWPPTSKLHLQNDIFEYCKLIFDEPQKSFYKVMAVILTNADLGSNFNNIENVTWTNIVEVLVQEKLNTINFLLESTEFNSKSIYTHFFAIYDVQSLKLCRTDDWFYLSHPLIQDKISQFKSHSKKRKISQTLPEFEIDLDELEKSLRREDNKTKFAQIEVKKMKYLMDDLEESMNIQKKILSKFNEKAKMALNISTQNC